MIDDEVENASLCASEEMLNGIYRFDNPWDMECCKTPYALVKKSPWYTPNEDPEWVYMFSRMEHLRKLIFSYERSGEKKFILGYMNIVEDFFKRNNSKRNAPVESRKDITSRIFRKLTRKWVQLTQAQPRYATYRTLDCSIRCYSILLDLQMCSGFECNLQFQKQTTARILKDLEFSVKAMNEFDEYSNWGLIRLSLYASSHLLLNTEKDMSEYILHIKRMLHNQIRADGGHIENSSMYHIQILICLLRLLHQMQLHNLYDEELYLQVKKMTLFAYDLSDDMGYQMMYGDSDLTSLDTVLYIAEHILSLEQRLYVNKPNDLFLLYEFPGLPDIDFKKPLRAKKKSCSLDGIWCYNSSQFMVRVFNEEANSGHRHADNGSIVLHYKSQPLLIDCGRYSYHEMEQRTYYKGAQGHNIATINHGQEWRVMGCWRFAAYPRVSEHTQITFDDGNTLGVRIGYSFPTLGKEFSRCVLVVDDSMVIILSYGKCASDEEPSTFSTYWNFHESVDSSEVSPYCAKLVFPSQEYLYMAHSHTYVQESGRMSPGYNEEILGTIKHCVSVCDDSVYLQGTVISKKALQLSLDCNFLKVIDIQTQQEVFKAPLSAYIQFVSL